MKSFRFALLFLFPVLASSPLCAQDFGLSFSYFIPKNGEFSTPVSPFSFRGVGVSLTNNIGIETGVTLYRMSGMALKDLPFETDRSLLGNNFTLFVPVELVFSLAGQQVQLDIKGGAFGYAVFDQRLNRGNFDRAIRELEQWQVANASASFQSKPGFGFHGGAELTVYVTQNIGISLETNYLVGESAFPIKGSYTGGNSTLETKTFDYADAKMDFTGLEFSIGVIYSSGGGKQRPRKRR